MYVSLCAVFINQFQNVGYQLYIVVAVPLLSHSATQGLFLSILF